MSEDINNKLQQPTLVAASAEFGRNSAYNVRAADEIPLVAAKLTNIERLRQIRALS